MSIFQGPIRNYHFTSTHLPSYAGAPTWLAYDHGARAFYVSENNSSLGVVPSGSTTVARVIAVGDLPFGVAYDSSDGRIFVANSLSNNLSVVSDTKNKSIGSVPVGVSPFGVAYDNASNTIFVANGGSDSVTAVNARTLKVLGTVSVGRDPVGIAYDPKSGYVFVANENSADVSVLSSAPFRAVTSIHVGPAPYGVAVDNRTGNVYVSVSDAGTVAVLAPFGNATVATVPVGGLPEGLAYDSATRTVWVAEGKIFVVVINATNQQVLASLLFDPLGAAYNPDNGDVCVTNAANRTFQCITPSWLSGGGLRSPIDFTETGLPSGTVWAISMSAQATGGGTLRLGSNTTGIHFPNSQQFWTFAVGPISGYTAKPANGQLLTTAAFAIKFTPTPSRYSVTFIERGIGFTPFSKLWWGVNLSGSFRATEVTAFTVLEKNGTYPYVATQVDGYAGPNGTVTVNGGPVTVLVPYQETLYRLVLNETGLAKGTSWNATLDDFTASSLRSSITFLLPEGAFPFEYSSAGYVASPARGTWTVEDAQNVVTTTFT